jgi:riboflavin kinase/FMN adenylyltransferase
MGRIIGFPTANIAVTSELVPKRGVYAVFVIVNKVRHRGVVNIGTAPTLGGKEVSVEAHIIDFKRKIYNRKIEVSFVRRLRDEVRFASEKELSRQIRKDIGRARRILRG